MRAPLRRGRSARDAGRWNEAEAAFRAALAAAVSTQVPDALRAEIIGELGLCALALHRYRDAAERLAESLSHRKTLSLALQRRFEDGRARAEARIVRLYLGVSPPDAEVLIDGKPVGGKAAARELFLEPGQHVVRGRLSGYSFYEESFSSSAGEARNILVHLQRVPLVMTASTTPAPAPTPAVATSRSSAGESLRLAGVIATATTALTGAALLVWSGVTDDDIAEQRSELRRKGWEWNTCSRPNAPTECSAMSDAAQRRDRLATLGLVSLAASGAIGVVTLGSFVVVHGEPIDAGGVRVVPLAGAGQAGVLVRGVW